MHKVITRTITRKYIIFKFALPRVFYFNLQNNTNLSLMFISVIAAQLLLPTPFILISKLHSSNFCHYCHPLKPSDSLSSTGFLVVSCPLHGSQPYTPYSLCSTIHHLSCMEPVFWERIAILVMESGLAFTFSTWSGRIPPVLYISFHICNTYTIILQYRFFSYYFFFI